MAGVREQNRAVITARILGAARDAVAADGAGMSMRAVAREVGIVSSAIYRYFPTKEALLTSMIIESYGRLAEALEAADLSPSRPGSKRARGAQWTALAHGVRDWARSSPNEFQLIYGTPLPGYVAPPETVPAAVAVARPFLEVGGSRPVAAYADKALRAQMADLVDDGMATDASGAAAVLAELGALVGIVTLELGGHLVGSADPADGLFAALVTRQLSTLGLD